MTFSRKLTLASAIIVALAALIAFASQVQATCESCYGIWTADPLGNSYHDAQCCLSSSYLCSNLAEDGWSLERSNLEWCSNPWLDGYGYTCDGQDGCSSGGWGGGGGGECTILPGEFCPTSCPSCTIFYY